MTHNGAETAYIQYKSKSATVVIAKALVYPVYSFPKIRLREWSQVLFFLYSSTSYKVN